MPLTYAAVAVTVSKYPINTHNLAGAKTVAHWSELKIMRNPIGAARAFDKMLRGGLLSSPMASRHQFFFNSIGFLDF
ncbi:hypothetical protein SLEP1_g27829 [Rubroshorea leprosula]|uniref:Uncharacterized protein n=1 Tax=Rubroshorea leprosula TaxID=152421 RepID=A0AAV5JUC6_9ROSI|nr:hypothetical protein SLEP1_g27829 [Rubroshorea leprosula]